MGQGLPSADSLSILTPDAGNAAVVVGWGGGWVEEGLEVFPECRTKTTLRSRPAVGSCSGLLEPRVHHVVCFEIWKLIYLLLKCSIHLFLSGQS